MQPAQCTKTVIAKQDTGEWTNLPALVEYQLYAFNALRSTSASTETAMFYRDWNQGWAERPKPKPLVAQIPVNPLPIISVNEATIYAWQLATFRPQTEQKRTDFSWLGIG